MRTEHSRRNARLTLFLALVACLSLPFWWLGWRFPGRPLPGRLPWSALMVIVPAVAASALTARASGWRGVGILAGRVFAPAASGTARWWIFSIVVMPAVLVVAFAPTGPGRRPGAWAAPSDLAAVAAVLALFLVAAAVEEIGWTAYATDGATARFGELGAGLALGVFWAAWHLVPWMQAGHSAAWMAAQSGFTVLLRTLQVMIYVRTGRALPPPILLHATANLTLTVGGGSPADLARASAALVLIVGTVRRTSPKRS